jgi:hypothetical protein
MKVLRWILVIPATLLVYWIVYVLQSLMGALFNYGMLSQLGIKVFASIIAGVAGVSAAISIAPNYKKAAAIIGAVVLFIPTLLSLWLILNGQDYSGGNWAVYVEGIASTAASIWTCVKYWQDETL